MIIILGLIVLIAAVVIGVAGGDRHGQPFLSRPRRGSRPGDSRRGSLHLFGHRLAPRQAAAGSAEPLNGQVVPDVPADTPAP